MPCSNDADGFRAEPADQTNLGPVENQLIRLFRPVLVDHPVGEDEVLRGDLDAVAPARLRPNVVAQREWLPRDDVDMRDEVRSERGIGLESLKAPSRTRLRGFTMTWLGRQATRNAFRHAGSRKSDSAMTTVPPRFGVCASAPPAPETATGGQRLSPRGSAVGRITSSQGESSASDAHASMGAKKPQQSRDLSRVCSSQIRRACSTTSSRRCAG